MKLKPKNLRKSKRKGAAENTQLHVIISSGQNFHGTITGFEFNL